MFKKAMLQTLFSFEGTQWFVSLWSHVETSVKLPQYLSHFWRNWNRLIQNGAGPMLRQYSGKKIPAARNFLYVRKFCKTFLYFSERMDRIFDEDEYYPLGKNC